MTQNRKKGRRGRVNGFVLNNLSPSEVNAVMVEAVDSEKVEAGSGTLTVNEEVLQKVKARLKTFTDAEAAEL